MQVLSGKKIDSQEPTLMEHIKELQKRAEVENKEFTVLLQYEGESARSYLFGFQKHENCGGHYQKK